MFVELVCCEDVFVVYCLVVGIVVEEFLCLLVVDVVY